MKEAIDDKGRIIGIKEMDPADQLDLFEACAKNSTNQAWVGMALLVCSATSIDAVPVMMPRTPDEVKALARKLGSSGIAAIAGVLNSAESDPAEVAATAKN